MSLNSSTGKFLKKTVTRLSLSKQRLKKMAQLEANLTAGNIPFEDVTGEPDTRYRIINYNPALFKFPVLLHVHFPERKGRIT